MRSLPSRVRVLGGLTLLSGLAAGLACSSPDLSGPTSTDPAQLYWALSWSAHAITMDTMAPYDTLQLTATARNALGEPLADAPLPTFTTNDSSVRVSATGVLTARSVRNNVKVVAELTYRGIRQTDTATVNVTGVASPQVFRQLQLQVQAGDTPVIPMAVNLSFAYYGATKTLDVNALDNTGTPIPPALIAVRTSDTRQATTPPLVGNGSVDVTLDVSTDHPGPLTVYASATIYGITIERSLPLTIANPQFALFGVIEQPGIGAQPPTRTLRNPGPAVIGAGGVIWWANTTNDSLDIVFDDPTAAASEGGFLDSGGGNISLFPGSGGPLDLSSSVRARRFPHVGTYRFHSPRLGIAGTIIVE